MHADSSLHFGRDGFSIRVRGLDDDQLVGPECFPGCDLDVCNFIAPTSIDECKAKLGSARTGAVERRDIDGLGFSGRSPADLAVGFNKSSLDAELELAHSYKRAPKASLPTDPWDGENWTVEQCAAYLPGQLFSNKPLQPQFQAVHENVVTTNPSTEAAMSAFATFENNKLVQIGSGGLHGCTIVVVVSQKAVWAVSKTR